MHLSYLGPVSCAFTSWVSSGLTVGSGCSLMAARWQGFFPSWVSLRLTHSRWRAAIADDCDVLGLLIWQEIFHFSPAFYTPGDTPSMQNTSAFWGIAYPPHKPANWWHKDQHSAFQPTWVCILTLSLPLHPALVVFTALITAWQDFNYLFLTCLPNENADSKRAWIFDCLVCCNKLHT